MTNSKALWIIVALLAIIVAFFVANAVSGETEKADRQTEILREMEQNQDKQQQDLFEEMTN